MSIKHYKSVVWVLCKCRACGHKQEVEEEHLIQRGARCEKCRQAQLREPV